MLPNVVLLVYQDVLARHSTSFPEAILQITARIGKVQSVVDCTFVVSDRDWSTISDMTLNLMQRSDLRVRPSAAWQITLVAPTGLILDPVQSAADVSGVAHVIRKGPASLDDGLIRLFQSNKASESRNVDCPGFGRLEDDGPRK